jgi:hypothetical protein
VQLTAAGAEAGGSQAVQQQAPAGDDDDDGGSNTLSIIALIVGIAGLAAGLAALFTRRRTPVGTA